MKKTVCSILLCLLLINTTAYAGLGSKKTMYVGGTIASVKEKTEGVSSSNK